MLAENSILRRVPANVDPKQALFIDGIRHAVEILELAYWRLRNMLTKVALTPPTSEELPKVSPQVFLDAWAMVDAIDRFRMLYQQFPGIKAVSSPEVEALSDVMLPFRKVRNISDHLAQTADQVVAKGGAALGTLTWLTGFNVDPVELWFCTLRPGMLRKPPKFNREPIETTVDWPTDRICLSAGGYEANLSAIRPHIELRLRHFEGELERQFERPEFQSSPIANDVFHRRAVKPAPTR